MMDCYYPDASEVIRVRKESFVIKALEEMQAISEAKAIASAQMLARVDVRKVTKWENLVIFSYDRDAPIVPTVWR